MAESKLTLGEELMEIFQWSYKKQERDFERLVEMQQNYDNSINRSMWSTISELPMPTAFMAVRDKLGPIMEGLFPNLNAMQLLPLEAGASQEQIRNSEFALWVTVHHLVRLQHASIKSVQNCLKCSLGYGIVETANISPPVSRIVRAADSEARIMAVGRAVRTLRYRDVSSGRIVPYPSGTEFNGTDRTPFAFFLDFYPEGQFRSMMEGRTVDTEDVELSGNTEEIIAKSRESGMHTGTTVHDVIEAMGGRKVHDKQANKHIPAMIPVIKVYEANRHTWIVPLATKPPVIYKAENKAETLRTPLVKWSAWPDGDRWFPMSEPEADLKRSLAYNIWFNMFFDMMSWMGNRNLVYNIEATDNKEPNLAPGQPLGVTTQQDVNKVAGYLDIPRIDPMIMNVGATLDGLGDRIHGQRDLTSKNFARGGMMAFQEVLNSSNARQRLTGAILDLGGLTEAIEHILIHMQINIPEGGQVFRKPAWDRATASTTTEERSVTPDDLRHSYQLILDLGAKKRFGGIEAQDRLQIYDRYKDRPDIHKEELDRLVLQDDILVQRLLKPPEVVEQTQAEDRAVALQQGLQGGPAQPSAPLGEQIAAGATLGGAA